MTDDLNPPEIAAPEAEPLRLLTLSVSNVLGIELAELSFDGDGGLITIEGNNGQGKAQPLSEPVLTPTGWRTMGEIQPGDLVVGGDGKPVAVLSVHPQQEREVWKVTFTDGSWTRCSPDHLWTVSKWKQRKSTRAERDAGETRRTILFKQERTMTLREIRDIGMDSGRGGPGRWQIPLATSPVWHETATLPIDPWELGVILGDGHITPTNQVVFSTDEELLHRLGIRPRPLDPFRSDKVRVGSTARWNADLVALGLAGAHSWDKFVPESYLTADEDQRRALLAGLLDTDGSPASTGVEFSSTSEALADAVVALTCSLGGTARKSEPRVTHFTHDGERRAGRPSWRVKVATPFNPFTLERKAARWSISSQRELARWIVGAERVDDEDCQCLRVDAADGLYLTRSCIVTHNSSLLNAIWLALAGGNASRKISRPVRAGSNFAYVQLELGDTEPALTVLREWDLSKSKPTKLVVSRADGLPVSEPQELLNALIGDYSFDPLKFAETNDSGRAAMYLAALGVDVSELEAREDEFYQRRTTAKNIRDDLKSQFKAATPPAPGLPDAEVSTGELVSELTAAVDEKARNDRLRREAADGIAAAVAAARKVRELEALLETAKAEADAAAAKSEHLNAETADLADPDIESIRERIDANEATNSKIREAAAWQKLKNSYDKAEDEVGDLELQLAETRAEIRKVISGAEAPIDGIFYDRGVVYYGPEQLPFAQACDSDKLRVSLAIAMALNPGIRLIRCEASRIDEQGLAIIDDMTRDRGYQILAEKVGVRPGATVVIEAGRVVGH